ncbi:MAG: DUF2809 domain-containing protein [Lachnospiraceae bacterium]|nr:DUF2809 domain-containing protein [Lachnospiraceae bacterium]
MRSRRVIYAIITIIILIIEIMIALFVHDSFIRPYVGDVLVVAVIYTFIRIIIPNKVKLLPLYIFLFSVFVELMQYANIVKLLGLQDNKFFSVLVGTTFDIKDIICYGVGCLLITIGGKLYTLMNGEQNGEQNIK